MEKTLVILLLGISLVSGFMIGGGGGGFGGGGGGGRSSSGSWSSEEGGGHGHGHHGRPPRPRPPPPQNDPRCETGWMTFDRPQGTWCVKVFYGGNLAQYTAENLCQAQGATLTGLQDASERIQIANAGRVLSNANGGGFAEVWVGASRKSGCVRKEDCDPNYTFDWTDNHTTGTDGFYWPGPEPNAVGNQDCLEVHVSVADGVAARFGYGHGDLDDQVFFNHGNLAQYPAENLCQAQGATLTGLQDASERFQLANAGRVLNNANGGGFAEIWLGAIRKPGCVRKEDCPPNLTFDWTDGHTTGTNGYYFPGPEPNAVGNQNCLELHVSAGDGVAARYGYSHGDLDDLPCISTESTWMYACGKLPR